MEKYRAQYQLEQDRWLWQEEDDDDADVLHTNRAIVQRHRANVSTAARAAAVSVTTSICMRAQAYKLTIILKVFTKF